MELRLRSGFTLAGNLKTVVASCVRLYRRALESRLFAHHVRKIFFVFADGFDQLLVCNKIQA